MVFGMKAVKHISSNGVVLVKDEGTVGYGFGEVRRSWAVEKPSNAVLVTWKAPCWHQTLSSLKTPLNCCTPTASKRPFHPAVLYTTRL